VLISKSILTEDSALKTDPNGKPETVGSNFTRSQDYKKKKKQKNMDYNCTRCGNKFEKGITFCQICGCNLELEYIKNPVCPECNTSYPINTKFCVNDGSKLVRQEDLVPKCVICNTTYSDDIKFCPRDGGEVKIILTKQFPQTTYGQTRQYQEIGSKQKYRKASLSNRFLAALLDGLILTGLSIPSIICFMMGMAKSSSYFDHDGGIELFILALLFYTIPLVYSFIKDGLGQGQSFGKKALDLMVVNLDNNTSCNKVKSFVRNFISGLVGIIPFIGWLIEPIMVLATEDGKKLGDKAANTQVINKKTLKKHNMNCSHCNTPNNEESKFCMNCGIEITFTPSNENTNSNQTVNQLLILSSVQAVFSLCYLILNLIVRKFDWNFKIIYDYVGWVSSITTIILLLLLAIITKQKKTRIFLIIFLLIAIIEQVIYRVLYKI
jgi:uncharacterized RDD family membrane protein YckC